MTCSSALPTVTTVYTADYVHLAYPGYEFQAPTRFDKLFSGTAIKLPATAPYTGDVPEMTFVEDADYGAMLERAYGKGVTSPTGRRTLPAAGCARVAGLRAAARGVEVSSVLHPRAAAGGVVAVASPQR